MIEFSPEHRAFILAQEAREAFADLSAADINRMDIAEFARLRGLTPVNPYNALYGPEATQEVPTAPAATQEAAPAPAASPGQPDAFEGLDPNSDEYFRMWRSQRGSNDAGHAVAGSPSGGIGRHGWVNSNVRSALRFEGQAAVNQAQANAEHARLAGLRSAVNPTNAYRPENRG